MAKTYVDDILVAGKVDATKMNNLKLAIQNNKLSVDEIKQISKHMNDLGITDEYYEVMKKIDFGKYLKNIEGAPPADMVNPYAHHILFKTGLGDAQKALVQEGQEILRKYGIDPIVGGENLVWAPNAVTGQHNLSAIESVVSQLKAVDSAGAGQLEIVKFLLDNGSEMDISLAKKNPLFGAIYGGHFEVVKELVDRGIDITVRYNGDSLNDMDAYRYAREFGQTEIADYLEQLLS